jgi:hypothetical protein
MRPFNIRQLETVGGIYDKPKPGARKLRMGGKAKKRRNG